MTELERYIDANIEAFDCEAVPSGSKARFMQAVADAGHKSRVRKIVFAISSAAAACAAVMLMALKPDISRELKEYHTRLAEIENEIMVLVETGSPDETDAIMNSVRSITAEAIPLEEQLPEELSLKEKSRILSDYYDRKVSALESLIAEYSE